MVTSEVDKGAFDAGVDESLEKDVRSRKDLDGLGLSVGGHIVFFFFFFLLVSQAGASVRTAAMRVCRRGAARPAVGFRIQ